MSLLQQAPRFDAGQAASIAREWFGVDAIASTLPSERDQNFLLRAVTGGRFVLKIANAIESRTFLDGQNAALARLGASLDFCPRLLPARTGDATVLVDGHLTRLVTWLPGRALAEVRWHSRAVLEDLGARLGELDRELEGFDHPALHRDFYWDLARAPRTIGERLPLVNDAPMRKIIETIVARIERECRARLDRLPRSIVHNDANDHNVLVTRERVTGLIDFGDMVHTFTIADPAVAMAYACLDKPDVPAALRAVAKGYHLARPFSDDELAVVFDLACLRLCLSVCVAADQQRQRPGDEYLTVSQAPIRRTLPRLAAIPPRLVEAHLRAGCGLDPVPRASRIVGWLTRGDAQAAPVLGTPLDRSRVVLIDLSVEGELVSADAGQNVEPLLTRRIDAARRDAHAAIGIGRYLEPRLLYQSPLFGGGDSQEERRTVHLGVDLFAPPGTPVHAPLRGRVHALADNRAPLDYGPVVILEHETAGGETFFTLYGHLGRDVLGRLRTGQQVDAGEPFAAIGTPDINGGWTPHLHFQIITDLLGLGTDVPGVCRSSEQDAWGALSPDPNLLLNIPDGVIPAVRSRAATLDARQRLVGPNVSLSYREPVKIVRGWMQYLYDEAGRRYLDGYNNVPHVGHSHPRVYEAVRRQMRVLNTNTRYLHDNIVMLAERLIATLPDPLRVCYFVNSGSEANELALRLARAHTRQRDTIVLDAAYHGHTTTLIDISPYKFNGPGGTGQPDWVHVVAVPDTFRGPHKNDDARAARRYAEAVGDIVERLRARGLAPAAFIAETCPSVGGQIVPPPGYLSSVYEFVRAAGGVCIADEVQTAYGRMGSSFYAFEAQEVVPDVLVLGKPIGNGYPLGAVVTTEEIAASFANGMEFFSTFGGSTVSCAAGLAVLEVVEEEALQAHAARVGSRLLDRLRPLVESHAFVGDVRGSGLFLGLELVKDRATLDPAAGEAAWVVNRMREEGILIGTDGPFHNVLKIRPPMPFTLDDADVLASTLDRVLGQLE